MRGFTLIETLVYLALLAIMFAGVMNGVYALAGSSARTQTQAMIEEEGDYLTAKIDQALDGERSMLAPEKSGEILTVESFDGSVVSMREAGGALQLWSAARGWRSLSNTDVTVSDLSFIYERHESDGIDANSMRASFILHATTSAGRPISRSFSTLRYLPR